MSLFGDAFQEIAQKLEAKDLAALACACKLTRRLVSELDSSVWVAAARRVLPTAHPLPQPATYRSVQQALQRYAQATRSIKAGVYRTQSFQADTASFNAAGSHFAVLQGSTCQIYDKQTMQCVTSFEGHGKRVHRMQWAQEGSTGVLVAQLDSCTSAWSVCHGELVQSSAQPWDTLKCTKLPDSYFGEQNILKISPDGSKVFICYTQEPAQSEHRAESASEAESDEAEGEQLIRWQVFDISTGAVLWEKVAELEHHLSDEMSQWQAMVWHPSGDELFHLEPVADDPEDCGKLWAVRLSDGFAQELNFSVAPEASLLTSPDGACISFALGQSEHAMLQWPSGDLLWTADESIVHHRVSWDWSGSHFACIITKPSLGGEGNDVNWLCILEAGPKTSIGEDHEYDFGPEWDSKLSCRVNDLFKLPKQKRKGKGRGKGKHCMDWNDSGDFGGLEDEMMLRFAFSPAGNFLAVAPDDQDLFVTTVSRYFVVVLDALRPGLPIVARLRFEQPCIVARLQWAPDSSALCVVGAERSEVSSDSDDYGKPWNVYGCGGSYVTCGAASVHVFCFIA